MSLDTARLDTALDTARTALLAERVAEGYWEGELSSSALSTAVACAAMQHVQTATGTEEHGALIQGGLHWLAQHANADGGWGIQPRVSVIFPPPHCAGPPFTPCRVL